MKPSGSLLAHQDAQLPHSIPHSYYNEKMVSSVIAEHVRFCAYDVVNF